MLKIQIRNLQVKILTTVLILGSCLSGPRAFAQEAVSQAAPSATKTPPKTFEGTAEVSAVVTNGNTRNQNTGLSADLTYRWTPWLMNVKSKYVSAVAQDIQTGESFEIAGRGARDLTDVDDVFIEHTFLKNRFAGVDTRNITSAGLGHYWIRSDVQTFKNEVGLGYTSENRLDGTKLGFMSGVVGLSYKYKLSATSDFNHETKYLPNFANSEDWRLTTETSISAAINSMFSSKVAWKYEHVNLPPAGKVRGDTTTTVSFLAKF